MFTKRLLALAAMAVLIACAGLHRLGPGRQDDQVHAFPARPRGPAQARRGAGLQEARRGEDERLPEGRDLPAGQLGNATTVLEGLRFGTVELAVVHDGGISSMYKAFDIFGLPYLFKNQKVA